jgi:UDP-N-acetylglucosamine 2-epimerase (non-hydrolysing)
VTPTTVLTVVGARPNFMKAAPIHRALSRDDRFRSVLVHTGQHYDPWMSEVFFRDLGVPEPEFSLAVGSGTHAEQTARVMTGHEPVLDEVRPDLVVVVGDVNSTLAGALTASKCGIRVAHVEAGLRSFDRTMPEEINRVVTDALSDVLLAPSPDAVRNLLAEGRPETSVHQVGNVMIDSLRACMDGRRDRRCCRPWACGDTSTWWRPSIARRTSMGREALLAAPARWNPRPRSVPSSSWRTRGRPPE